MCTKLKTVQEIGGTFGDVPLAVAVQKGNHYMKEQMGIVILQLMKERYFEVLQSKYVITDKEQKELF